jgi:hypothetical protein
VFVLTVSLVHSAKSSAHALLEAALGPVVESVMQMSMLFQIWISVHLYCCHLQIVNWVFLTSFKGALVQPGSHPLQCKEPAPSPRLLKHHLARNGCTCCAQSENVPIGIVCMLASASRRERSQAERERSTVRHPDAGHAAVPAAGPRAGWRRLAGSGAAGDPWSSPDAQVAPPASWAYASTTMGFRDTAESEARSLVEGSAGAGQRGIPDRWRSWSGLPVAEGEGPDRSTGDEDARGAYCQVLLVMDSLPVWP